ncbi:MAG: flagellar motor stator protein MotA [Verrucomicrobia bacterium]|nr:flagellar motor stator protein MotA [Verrucomicrobiota bacterium]
MIILLGALIVTASVIGGFLMAHGKLFTLLQWAEFVVILGSAFGAMVTMSPKKVLLDLFKLTLKALKGAPYNKAAYEDLLKALYELFMLGRRNGMIALEEHVMNPQNSPIFSKYPSFLKNHHAVEFLCNSLRPIIDGKIKPDQLKLILDIELESRQAEHHAPVNVLTRTADSMPGFGIVAAVLGIVVTMGSIGGPVDMIGKHVAAALVGTFLGILVCYGYLSPLAMNLEFLGAAEFAYAKCIADSVVGFAHGMAPIMAVEVARRGLSSDVQPSADELEQMLKSVGKGK